MSETYTKTFAGMQQAARRASRQASRQASLGIALSLTVGLAASLGALADGEIALKNVTSDAKKQLVVQFATGQGAPQAPKIMEVPPPTHQLLIDFTGVTLDDNTVPSGDQLTKQLAAKMPGVRAARVGSLANSETPTVRVALDLDPDLTIKPSIAGLQDGSVTISLGDNYSANTVANIGILEGEAGGSGGAPAPAAASATSPSAANDPAAAYEEYYRKFLQQKQMTNSQVPEGAWGPRTGTAEEAKQAKHGVRIIGTPLNSPVLADVPKTEAPEEQPARSAAPVAEAAAATQPAAEVAAAQPAAAESAPATAQPAEAAPQAAEASPAPEAAPVAKSEPASAAQPDMVAETESAAAPPVTAAAPPPPVRAPRPGAPARPAESAASPSDAAAASDGAASMEAAPVREQDKAENQAQAALPTDENANEPPRRRARRIFNDAVANHTHGHITQAINGYKEALKLDPDLGDAYSNLGLAYNQMHNYASALSEFHKALAINPRDAITYNGVGAALRAEQDMPGAIKNWETAVKLDPKLAVAHYNLGTAYEQEGEFDKALVSYTEAVKNDQRLGEAYFRMGIIMQKRHRLQDAKAHYKQALKVSADSDYAAEAKAKIAAIDKLAK